MTEQELKEILEKAKTYCAKAERSPKQIDRWLERKSVNAKDKEHIVRQLQFHNFLSYERYAEAYIRDRLLYARWGERKIKFMLYQQGVGKNTIDHAWLMVARDEYGNFENNLEQLLIQKVKSVKAKNQYELVQKLVRFAISRGYDIEEAFDVAKRVVDYDEFE